jgi:hypothetical protein
MEESMLKTIKLDNEEYIRKADVDALQKQQAKIKQTSQPHPYVKGQLYHVETATKYYIGTCSDVTDQEIVLQDAAWVAHTGRLNAYLSGSAPTSLEPLNGPVFISRGAIVAVIPYTRKIEIVVR